MPILNAAEMAAPAESSEIAGLHAAFSAQRAAFAADCDPSLTERRRRLKALIGMMASNRTQIAAALASDFGAHPVPASDLIEVLVHGAARRSAKLRGPAGDFMAQAPPDYARGPIARGSSRSGTSTGLRAYCRTRATGKAAS